MSFSLNIDDLTARILYRKKINLKSRLDLIYKQKYYNLLRKILVLI